MPDKQAKPENILAEAERLIHGQRRDDYGGVAESFGRIARMWSEVLGCPVAPTQVAMCMIALKMSRWTAGHQRDSLVDICGYAALIEEMEQE